MARTASPNPARAAARLGTLVIIALVALGGLGLLFTTWRTIDPGYVGIVFDKASHKVTNTLDPGWVFINPLTESITRYPVGVQTLVMVQQNTEGKVSGDDSVKVGTREGQTMFADVSVQYSVDRNNAAQLYQTWAGAPIETIEDNLVRQVTRSVLNDVASQYGWEEIFGEKRVEYTGRIADELGKRFAAKYVKFESLNLRGWHLPDNLQKALDAKITAQQAAEQQQYSLNQAKIKAEQDKVQAEGEANALRAQAQGEADATKIRAQAQAEANKLLAQSITPELIRYQQLQKWDGKLPVFNGSGATPLIDATSIISGTSGR
ncbi:MAG TPA: prohibitin family protein [Kouleothrix sp.]|uniref:prohibitin family protein n=1 Tax=Kouleothrix sp. TaxID=2779161 RepID=UPI002CECBD32|nr:prohibitin family protein [Kouleothrix sp.]HRC75940.1 prohibitin family protein [Kouleothrix sp.]